jgi:hypothetical protein
MSLVTYCVVLILLCHNTHEEMCPHTCQYNGLWTKLWCFCILWVTESCLNWMQRTVCSVSHVETSTRTNQSITCLPHISFSLLFTPLTMDMKNMLFVIMQWRGYLYVILLGRVMWCVDCAHHTCAQTECLFCSKCEPEFILSSDWQCLDNFSV